MRNLLLLMFLMLLFSCRPGATDNAVVQYKPYSSSTLEITLKRDLADTLFAEVKSITNVPSEPTESELIAIRNAGVYYLNLVVDRPHAALLILNKGTHDVIVNPGDTTEIMIAPGESGITLEFTGKNSKANDYYLAKKTAMGYSDIRTPLNQPLTSKASYQSIKNNTDTVTKRELQYLNAYNATHTLPDWFYLYEKAQIEYTGAGFKTQIPNYNEIFDVFKDSLPATYFDFLKDIRINNEEALLSSSYILFLSNYFITDLPIGEFYHMSGYARSEKINRHILARSGPVLSANVKDVFYKYLLSNTIQYIRDSAKIDSLAYSYGVRDYKSILKVAGLRSKAGFSTAKLSSGDAMPDIYAIDNGDSLYAIRDFGNNIVYINFWATWCGPCIQNMPALNTLISEYALNDNVRFINICLDSDRAKWETMVKKNKLQGTNLFAEGAWNDKMRALFNIRGIPHYVLVDKGNVVRENGTDKAPDVKDKIEELLSVTQ